MDNERWKHIVKYWSSKVIKYWRVKIFVFLVRNSVVALTGVH
jgi:hypothetical protein